MCAKKSSSSELESNRRAFFDYEILETFEAGIVLLGTEVKSLRAHHASLQDSYILISNNEAFLKNSSISAYKFGTIYNHEEKRDRILLLHKREIEKLKRASEEKGFTLIPLSFYLKEGLVKAKIAIARGKKHFDKRGSIKEKEEKRKIERILKRH
ncbi:MAG TPA: SsrA-binding protein SmpB [Rhabdochlamydiaceae bacterium]|nr:SsrA-binding protein SmpB [Rhabdochlamydiaceae bacterium]